MSSSSTHGSRSSASDAREHGTRIDHFSLMDVSVHIGVLRVDLVVPGARSLKDLRRPTVSLRDRLASRFGLAAHQVASAQRPARAVLVGTTVGNDARAIRTLLDRAAHFCRTSASAPVTNVEVDVFPWQGRGTMSRDWELDFRWSGDE